MGKREDSTTQNCFICFLAEKNCRQAKSWNILNTCNSHRNKQQFSCTRLKLLKIKTQQKRNYMILYISIFFKSWRTLHLEYWRLQPRTMKMIEELKQLSYGVRLKELGYFSFWKMMFQLFETFFFAARVVKHWNKSPSKVIESLSLQIFKIQLDTALNSLL